MCHTLRATSHLRSHFRSGHECYNISRWLKEEMNYTIKFVEGWVTVAWLDMRGIGGCYVAPV